MIKYSYKRPQFLLFDALYYNEKFLLDRLDGAHCSFLRKEKGSATVFHYNYDYNEGFDFSDLIYLNHNFKFIKDNI